MPRTALFLIMAAYAAFTIAVLIHNSFGLDPAVVLPTLFVGLLLWRRRRGFLIAAVIVIAVPAFAFLKPVALSNPDELLYFFNHLALLSAGVLAVAAAVVSLNPAIRELRTES